MIHKPVNKKALRATLLSLADKTRCHISILAGTESHRNNKEPRIKAIPNFFPVKYETSILLTVSIVVFASGRAYFIVVTDEKNQSGKYSLATGTIEDFSGVDFFTILPKAWFDTKLFVNDYLSLGIFFGILGSIVVLSFVALIKKKSNQNPSNKTLKFSN